MIEEVIVDYLSDNLGLPAYLEQPNEKPERYIVIDRTGSSVENYIKKATVAIQSYAETMYQAAILNEQVKKAMDEIIYHCDISRSKLNTDYEYTDTDYKRYRYQAVYDIAY